MLLEKIETLLKEVSGLTAANAEEIEQFRLKYLSKKGEINALMADFRNVAAEEKKTVGIKINQLKQTAIARINELAHKSKTTGLTEAEKAEQQALRKEYIEDMKSSLRAQLERTSIKEPDGTIHRVSKKN